MVLAPDVAQFVRSKDIGKIQYAQEHCATPGTLDHTCLNNAITACGKNCTVVLPLGDTATGATFVKGQPGQTYTFMVCQDSAGLHSFTWPTSFRGVVSIPSTALANTCAIQSIVWDGTRGYGVALGQLNL